MLHWFHCILTCIFTNTSQLCLQRLSCVNDPQHEHEHISPHTTAAPPLTSDPPVKKELLMRLNDGDTATCLDLAHVDHYTWLKDISLWEPEPQDDCWLKGLLIRMPLPGQTKTSFNVSISGHRLVCANSHFQVIMRPDASRDCLLAGQYNRCELSGPVDGVGFVNCSASCTCAGGDCKYVLTQMLRRYDDWKLCEIKIE